jgi:hypothetical protein
MLEVQHPCDGEAQKCLHDVHVLQEKSTPDMLEGAPPLRF